MAWDFRFRWTALPFRLRRTVSPKIAFLRLEDEDPDAWQFARLTLEPAYQLAVAVHRRAPPDMEILVRKILPLRYQEPGRLLPPVASRTWAL